MYTADERPWVIGFSGGKDSTAVLSLVYESIVTLSEDKRNKTLYVVSSDTLVETPVVVDQIKHVLKSVASAAGENSFKVSLNQVHPKKSQTFWANLLGRGYPAPTKSFRWCTERMKIDPVNTFILDKVAEFGEAIIVLGSRRQESATRAQVIARHRIKNSLLGRHKSLPNAYTYMPIEDWSADEVWEYLLGAPTPWGDTNKKLFELYKGSNQGECPLVIDTSTPSCGNSRFGCWTCTVVNEDKAMHGLIESGETWMQPLLDFRNELAKSTIPENKRKYRNYKRRSGKVTFSASKKINDDSSTISKVIPGPYWMKQRKTWLRRLLKIEKKLRQNGQDIELIQRDELHEIRQQWLSDPNEPDWKDSLPKIYKEVYPDDPIQWVKDDFGTFSEFDIELVESLSKEYSIPAPLVQKLIDLEVAAIGSGNRRGIQKQLDTLLSQDWESLEKIENQHHRDKARYSDWEKDRDEIMKMLGEQESEFIGRNQ